MMNRQRWDKLANTFGLQSEHTTFDALVAAYSEKHRAYHTAKHIDACLDALDHCDLELSRSHELEMAFWFHDAIYRVFSSTNEEDSAAWAVKYLQHQNVAADSIARIKQYILDTKHAVHCATRESCVVVDIDLAILGAAREQYEWFEEAIAREYRAVPKLIYRQKRKQVLRSFLKRAQLYQTATYRERLEPQARVNLQWAIERLS